MISKEYINSLLPNLKDYEIFKNTESGRYNCISHTIGITFKVSWPISDGEIDIYWPISNKTETKKAFDEFYIHHGYSLIDINNIGYESGLVKVALFAIDNIPQHASLQLDNDYWESKLGPREIIKHKLLEMNGGFYGYIVQIYAKKIL